MYFLYKQPMREEKKYPSDPFIDLRLVSLAKMFSEAVSILIFFVGALVLIGWKFNIIVLTNISPRFPSMAPNTALGLLFLGAALWLLQEKRLKKWTRNLGWGCAASALLLGLATLTEYVFGWNLFIDQFLFQGVAGSNLPAHLGRMALGTCFIFIFFGLALLFLDVATKRGARPAQIFAILGGIISMVAVVGYIDDVSILYQNLKVSISISIHAAMVFFIFNFGILLARPERGLTKVLVASSFAGKTVRRLLPATFVIPLIIAWLVEYGEHSGLYDVNFGIGLETVVDITSFSVLVLVSAILLESQEKAKIKVDRLLFENEKKYHDLVESMNEGLGVQDKNGIITFVNRRACEMLGYKPEEVIGKPVTLFFDKEGQKILKEQMVKRRKGGIKSYEVPCLRKNGEKVYTIVAPSPFFDEEGDFAGSVFVFTDITDRKLREISELRYRRLFEAAKDGILLVDFDSGMITDVNQFLIDMLGYSKENFLGKALWDIGFFKDIVASQDKFLELQTKKYVHYENLPLETKNGKKMSVEFVSNVYDVAGKKTIQCNIRDISERVLAEAEVEKEKLVAEDLAKDLEKFKLAVDGASDHIMITDIDGNILYANKAVETITGYTQEEIIGKNPGKLWGGHMAKDFYVNMWHNIKAEKKLFVGEVENRRKNNEVDIIEMENRRKNGEIYTAELRISPILDADGSIKFFVGIERDITKLKEIEQTQRDFISFTSHQLRTPLTVMNWNTEMLLSGDAGELTPEQKRYVTEIEHGEKRMGNLISSLLNISRLEAEKIKIEPKPTNIIELISGSISELAPFAAAKNCTIKFNKPDQEPPAIDLDPTLLKQVILNLLNNAIRYAKPNKSKIVVAFKEVEGYYQIDVADEGIGIPVNVKSKIFDKFFRADNAVKVNTEGIGLGLYITKLIIETSGGKIWFESTEGKGTTFHFTIPLSGMRPVKREKGLAI